MTAFSHDSPGYDSVPEALTDLMQILPEHVGSPSQHHLGISPSLLACHTGSQLIMNYLKEVGANIPGHFQMAETVNNYVVWNISSAPGMCTKTHKFLKKKICC